MHSLYVDLAANSSVTLNIMLNMWLLVYRTNFSVIRELLQIIDPQDNTYTRLWTPSLSALPHLHNKVNMENEYVPSLWGHQSELMNLAPHCASNLTSKGKMWQEKCKKIDSNKKDLGNMTTNKRTLTLLLESMLVEVINPQTCINRGKLSFSSCFLSRDVRRSPCS